MKNMHIMSTNFAKTLVWKHGNDVKLWRHKQRTMTTIWPWTKPPAWTFSPCATETQSLSHHRTHMTYICGRKYHHCSSRSLFPYKSTEGWDGCRLWWNPTWILKALSRGILWLTRACQVAWCSGRNRKIGKLGWSFPYSKMEIGEKTLTTRASLSLASLERCFMMPSALNKHAAK